MAQIRYTIQQHNINSKLFSRLSYINFYSLDKPSNTIIIGHPYARIIFIQKGGMMITIDGQTATLSKGDILIVNPDITSASVPFIEEHVEFVSIGLENVSFEIPANTFSLLKKINPEKTGDIARLIDLISRELEQKREDYSLACNLYIRILLINMERDYNLSVIYGDCSGKSSDVDMVKDYLDLHYAENLNLDMLSKISNMNRYYLVHSFTKYYGCSPISYLNEKKIEESKRLLEHTNLTIAEVADRLGFSSQSYFSQAFKKNTKMTPNEYRQSTKSY